MLNRYSLACAAFALIASGAQAATITPWTPLFQGVDRAMGFASGEGVAPLKTTALRFDLEAEGVGFLATPANGDAPLEVDGQTTGAFLEANGLQAAMNATFFSPCCDATSQPKDNLGLVISEGEIVSPAEPGILPQTGLPFTSLVITPDNMAALIPQEAVDGPVDTAVSGSLLLRDGVILVAEEPADGFADRNPRSAVGLSEDGRYMYWMVADGRQPGVSEGATLYETAMWLMLFGADDGLNLDGGGSSTLVIAGAGGMAELLNAPSGGAQRFNGVSIGAFAAPLAALPLPPAAGLLLVALAALGATRRRRAARG